MSGNNVKKEDKKDKKDKLVCKLNASGEPELSLNIDCVEDLIEHIKGKKRRLYLYRKILELKYNRYKKCHNFWSISTILLSSFLTLIESCKLIFLDEDSVFDINSDLDFPAL